MYKTTSLNLEFEIFPQRQSNASSPRPRAVSAARHARFGINVVPIWPVDLLMDSDLNFTTYPRYF